LQQIYHIGPRRSGKTHALTETFHTLTLHGTAPLIITPYHGSLWAEVSRGDRHRVKLIDVYHPQRTIDVIHGMQIDYVLLDEFFFITHNALRHLVLYFDNMGVETIEGWSTADKLYDQRCFFLAQAIKRRMAAWPDPNSSGWNELVELTNSPITDADAVIDFFPSYRPIESSIINAARQAMSSDVFKVEIEGCFLK